MAGRRHQKSVLFIGFLGTGNLGNDISLAVVAEAFARLHPRLPMEILSFGPAQTTTTGLPLTSLSLSRTTALCRFNRTADRAWVKLCDLVAMTRLLHRTGHVIVPGSGTLESGIGDGAWGLPWALAATAVLARLTGTKMHLLAVGADRASDPRTAYLNRVTSTLAASRSYRDELSRQAVAGLGVDVADDPVVSDLAFSRADASARRAPREGPRRRVGLGVQAWPGDDSAGPTGSSAQRDYTEAIGRIAAGLLDDGFEVTLLIGDRVDSTTFEHVRRSVSEHGRDPESVRSQASATFDDLVEVMAAQDVVVASRFHNLIGAAVAARPIIALAYGPKHHELMAGLGLSSWTHDVSAIDVEEVIRQVNHAVVSAVRTGEQVNRESLRRGALVDAHLDDFIASVVGPPHSIELSGPH